jgi:hypothetical protein
MRARPLLSLLLPAAFACSGSDPSPTGLRPEFLTGCTTKPTISPGSSKFPVNAPAGSTGNTATFLVKNNCSTATVPWDFTASRTGQVSSVGAPSPGFEILTGGQTRTVTVSFATASSAGSGTVVLTATSDGPPIATTSGTQSVTVTAGATGVPFGPFDLFKTSTEPNGQLAPFSLTVDFTWRQGIAGQIKSARDNHIRLVMQMAGGNHDSYLDSTTVPPKFSFAKWKRAMDSLDVPTVRDSVAAGVADGTILFNSLMDEPNHPSWGGRPDHALLDSMSRYAKGIFPTLKMGVVQDWRWGKTIPYEALT